MRQLSLTAVLLATLLMPLSAQASTAINWVGGVGTWDAAGAWDAGNGAESALDIFSRENGWDSDDGPVNAAITIGGSDSVVFDKTVPSGTSGDFRLHERTPGNSASLTVQNGAVFELQSSVHFEGTWTEFDSGPVNVTGAGSVLKRTYHGAASTAGALVLGSWRSYDGQEIELNVEDGGRLENNGQIWFGSLGENGSGIEVVVNIDGGHIDNTNGSVLIGGHSGISGEIKFNYGFNKDESYAINFGHSGSITVDAAGIRIQEETAPGVYSSIAATYEELWNRDILQVYGLTVQDGLEFNDYFRVEGQSGSDDYTLIRVPEPTTLALAGLGLSLVAIRRRR